MRRTLPILALLTVMSGCVTRIIRIESDPKGADIWLDGKPAGKTPKDIPFVWYGDRELSLEKEGYHSVREIIKVRPPWWQVFPIDFFAEFLIGDTKHRYVDNLIVHDENVFGFLGVYVHTTRDDHEMFTICEEQITLIIDVTDIPKRAPSL